MTMVPVLFRDRIECEALLTRYTPGRPMQVYGCGYGDAHPPEPEEFAFELYRNGKRCRRLERILTDDDEADVIEALKRKAVEDAYADL